MHIRRRRDLCACNPGSSLHEESQRAVPAHAQRGGRAKGEGGGRERRAGVGEIGTPGQRKSGKKEFNLRRQSGARAIRSNRWNPCAITYERRRDGRIKSDSEERERKGEEEKERHREREREGGEKWKTAVEPERVHVHADRSLTGGTFEP